MEGVSITPSNGAIPATVAPAQAATENEAAPKDPSQAPPAEKTIVQSSGVIESDEDDVPLSALAKNGKPESDGGGALAPSLPACQPPASATPVASTTGASVPAQYENDDDMPISKLMRYPNLVFAHAKKRKEGQSKQIEGNGSGGQGEEKSKKVKQEPPGEEEDASRSQEGGAKKKKKRKDGDGDSGGAMSGNGKSKVTRNSAANKSAAHGQRTQDFYMLDKGELVQKLLRRWWYAIQWPDSSCATQPPPDYETLEGYPGVFVCVRGPAIGHVLDKRNHAECPNFTNFARKPAAELKDLLLKALAEQRRQLQEHEGGNRKLEKKIEKERRWVERLDAANVDKEAIRRGWAVTDA